MRPQSAPPTMIDTDIEAETSMFFRYWMWIGETLRSTQSLMSSGLCACLPGAAVNGAGA